jgi:hypothetical protein
MLEHRHSVGAPNGHVTCCDLSGLQTRLAHRRQAYVPVHRSSFVIFPL